MRGCSLADVSIGASDGVMNGDGDVFLVPTGSLALLFCYNGDGLRCFDLRFSLCLCLLLGFVCLAGFMFRFTFKHDYFWGCGEQGDGRHSIMCSNLAAELTDRLGGADVRRVMAIFWQEYALWRGVSSPLMSLDLTRKIQTPKVRGLSWWGR